MPFAPHLRFGQCVRARYQIFRTVRHEKVFSVTRAYDLAADRPVQLCAFPQAIFGDFPQARGQLRFQVETLARVRSPFLVNLLEAGEAEGLFFFVEEAPRGRPLGEVLRERRRQNRPFSDREALGLCRLLCRALEAVHRVAVHGFLHPLEIYLEPWPSGPLPFYPRVAHAGVRAMLRTVLRSPLEGLEEEAACYASPEFEAFGPLGKQTDVYGLGAILYALLTLRRPTGQFVRPSHARPGLPGEIDGIVLRALDEDREERYPAPEALARALENTGVLGTWEKELDAATERLLSDPEREELEAAVTPVSRRERGRAVAGERLAEDMLSVFPADRVRAACLVLLVLLSLGLFLQAVLEGGLAKESGRPDLRELSRWEALFSTGEGKDTVEAG